MKLVTMRKTSTVSNQKGSLLIEALIAIALFAIIGSVFLSALSTGFIALGLTDEQVTAQVLARTQLEDTKSQPYVTAPTTYPTTVTPPDGYSVSVEALPIPDADDSIQKIKVTVSRDGYVLLEVEDYKVNR